MKILLVNLAQITVYSVLTTTASLANQPTTHKLTNHASKTAVTATTATNEAKYAIPAQLDAPSAHLT